MNLRNPMVYLYALLAIIGLWLIPDLPFHSVDYNTRATVLIGAIGFGNSYGTGFLIGDQYVVTAAHVVNRMPIINIRTFNKDDMIGEVVALDKERDLAVVRLPKAVDISPMAIVCSHKPQGGQQVYATGMGRGFLWTTRFGKVMRDAEVDSPAVLEDNEPQFEKIIAKSFIMEIQAIPGMSGSAIQDNRGNVIGVMSIGGLDGYEIGFAVKSKYLCQFLKENSISHY